MSYTIDQIKNDLKTLNELEFYTKHLVRSENWYFENILGTKPEDQIKIADDVKLIISENFNISFNCVMMVGSGKVGCSLSPVPNKLFKPFNNDEKIRNISDLDFAIISNDIFQKYWYLFRHSFKIEYKEIYSHVYQDLYRGYISEYNIEAVDGCRKEWGMMAYKSKKELKSKLFIKNEISYRIYRSWEDFEDYNLQTIKKIKRGI